MDRDINSKYFFLLDLDDDYYKETYLRKINEIYDSVNTTIAFYDYLINYNLDRWNKEINCKNNTIPEKNNYVYLLKEREFIKTKEPIYKIGKTTQENFKRFRQYPKQSTLLFHMICDDCDEVEKKIMILFSHKYINRTDIGNEYFEGDYHSMIDDIFKIVRKDKKILKKIKRMI